MNTLDDFKVGSRVRLLRYGGLDPDSPYGPGKNFLGTVSGTDNNYVVVDFTENSTSPFDGEGDVRCLPSELELIAIPEQKSATVIYNGDDLARISKVYNSLLNIFAQHDLDDITATLSQPEGDYILADFRVEDEVLVADLSRYGRGK